MWERDVVRGYTDVCGFAVVSVIDYWEGRRGPDGVGY